MIGYHYMNVLYSVRPVRDPLFGRRRRLPQSDAPLIIVRVPLPMPPWRSVMRALTAVMRSYGYQQNDIFAIEGLTSNLYPEWNTDDVALADKVDRAIAGDTTVFRQFAVYDWRRGRFVLARPAQEQS